MTEQEIDIVNSLRNPNRHILWKNDRVRLHAADEITRLCAELAEAREAVGVLARNLADFTMHQGIAGQMLNCATDEVNANPTARAALEKAGGGA
jgi:hypothetical protein